MTTINADSLRLYRARARLSQEALAERSGGVTKATISRIERGITKNQNKTTIERLASALSVTPEALTKAPESTADSRLPSFRSIRIHVTGDTALALMMAEQRYGVSVKSQIEMAPLFFTLLAEASLAWRRAKVTEIYEAADRMYAVAKGVGHLAFANSVTYAEEGAAEEEALIDKRDLFARGIGDDAYNFGFNPTKNNPFADYLRQLASEIDRDVVELDNLGVGEWRTPEGMPHYAICEKELNRITGSNSLARLALSHGYATRPARHISGVANHCSTWNTANFRS